MRRKNDAASKKTEILQWTAIILWIIALLTTAGVIALVMHNTVVIETQIIQSIVAFNSSSGIFINNSGTVTEIFNTGIHSLQQGPGIIIDSSNQSYPIVSVNQSYIGNCSFTCTNTSSNITNYDLFNCSASCYNDVSCYCLNLTITNQNITITNITEITINNVTVFSNNSCCASLLHAGIGINLTNNNGFLSISNNGVVEILLEIGLKNVGTQQEPILETDIIAGDGVSITPSGPNALVFNNTGVLVINQGPNILVNSSNGNGTGNITISIPFKINNINAGPGINITTISNNTIVTNIGVLTETAGPGISLLSSFSNGKGIVTINNTGVIQLYPGNNVNITGTNQYPVVNFIPASISALKGIFVNNSNNVYNIGNIGVTKIINSTGIQMYPPSGTGVVNITSDCLLSNLTAGSFITITQNVSQKIISSNLVLGKGLKFTGANSDVITADLAAGNGIIFTGAHPIVISSNQTYSIFGSSFVTITSYGNGTNTISLQPFPNMRAIMSNNWNSIIPNCLIGYKNTSTNYWSCPDQQFEPNPPGNASTLYCPSQLYNYGEYWIPVSGYYLISFNVEGSSSLSGVSLVILNGTAGSCNRCSTGPGACQWTRIITSGGYFRTASSTTSMNVHAASVFYFTQGQVLGLQQTYTIGYGTIYGTFFSANPVAGPGTSWSVQFLRPF